MFSVDGKRRESFVLIGMFFQAVQLTRSLIQQLFTGYICQGTSYGCEQKRYDPSPTKLQSNREAKHQINIKK